jgi:peroxiredoxin
MDELCYGSTQSSVQGANYFLVVTLRTRNGTIHSMSSSLKIQEIGAAVDDFLLPSLQRDTGSLSSMLSGKKGGVVVFWSGVCSHCTRYDGYFNTFEQQHPELALVAVASRNGETPEQIRKTAAERGLTFPILHDEGGKIAREWRTQQTPRAFLIDGNRTLLYRGAIDNYKYPDDPVHVGYLEPAVTAFLSGQRVLRAETASFGCAIQSVYYILPIKL